MTRSNSSDSPSVLEGLRRLVVLKNWTIRSAALLIAVTIVGVGCRDGRGVTAPGETASSLEVGPDHATLAPGDTLQLHATPLNDQGASVSGYEIDWTVSDTSVATVDGDGTVVALSAGYTEVKASAERKNSGKGSGADNTNGKKKGLSKTSDITVTDPGFITELKPTSYEKDTLQVGDSVYVDRASSIEAVPSRYRGWRYVRTASVDRDASGDSAIAFTLTDTALVALGYDDRATTLPDWLRDWSTTGEKMRTSDADFSIYTRVFMPGEVVLGGNLSGGAEGAQSMFVLSATRSDTAPPGGEGDDTTSGTGALTVITSTTGDDLDSDGYAVSVDGSSQRSVGVNDTVSYADLSVGDHRIDLSGLASNCSVSGSNPRTVTITENASVSTSYDVSCETSTSATGSLEVNTTTTGDDLDTDGFTVYVDGGSARSIGLNDAATYSALSAQDHSVELSGVASNCSISGSNPRTVTVPENDSVSTSFDIACDASSGSGSVTPVFSDDLESGDLGHSESGYGWSGLYAEGRAGVNTENPRSGSYSILLETPAQPNGEDAFPQANLNLPGVKEFWMEYYLWIPSNYHHRDQSGPTNNKWWQVYDNRSNVGLGIIPEVTRTTGGESAAYRYVPYEASDVNTSHPCCGWKNGIAIPVIVQEDYGTWVQYRHHVKASDVVAPGSEDSFNGVYEFWKNGTLLHGRYDLGIRNTDTAVSLEQIRILGWANSGFSEVTSFYIDDVKIWTEDPGW